MRTRFVLAGALAIAAGLAPIASGAACGTVTTRNSATLSFGEVQISMYENQDNDVCSDVTITQQPFDRRLTIVVEGDVVCDRTTDIDPSFDPFFLGAGIHPNPAISCGADFSLIGLTTVATPDPSTVEVDPLAPYAQAGLTKAAVTETPGSFWYGGDTFEIPQDSSGTVTRGAGAGG